MGFSCFIIPNNKIDWGIILKVHKTAFFFKKTVNLCNRKFNRPTERRGVMELRLTGLIFLFNFFNGRRDFMLGGWSEGKICRLV